MIVYSVTVNLDESIVEDWLQWMKEIHIPELMQTGLFEKYRILKVLSKQEDETGQTFNIQYDCSSIEKYEKYQEYYAQQLQKEHTDRYAGKFFAFRTILEQA